TDALWAQQFNRAGDILGRTVRLNDEAYEVIAVLAPEFVFPDPTVSVDAYAPIDHPDYNNREIRPLQAIARLKADAGFGRARSELRAIGARLAQAFPEDNLRGGGDLEGIDEAWKSSRRRPLALLTAAAFLLWAIVCTNVINPMLSRALARRREM